MQASNQGRAVITLPPPAANAARRLGQEMGGIGIPEVVRRGLSLLDTFLDLNPGEELVIRDRETGQSERLRFSWTTYTERKENT